MVSHLVHACCFSSVCLACVSDGISMSRVSATLKKGVELQNSRDCFARPLAKEAEAQSTHR